MKSIKLLKLSVLTLLLPTSVSFGQFVDILPETAASGGGYMVGDVVELGINWGGHEGTWDAGAPWCPNERGATFNPEVQVGFVANPADDGWGNYDGDFFSPGTPENGFGLELGGVNYSNNANNADWTSGLPTQEEIPGDLIGFSVEGDCMEVEWEGAINGIQVNVLYKLVSTELYYTTKVTLTNTNPTDELDVYYYRNLDPDNNQPIGWGFVTTNTIQEQPDVDCEMALVSAEQSNLWDNYFGLGALGENFRVTYGGFTNRDASDIWTGAAPFIQAEGSTSVGDQGISLAYYIDNLEAGTSEEFQFAVIMSGDDVDAAISNLYYFDYDGGGGVIDECTPVVDTVEICPGGSANITVDGPSAADYTWVWTPDTDLTTDTGPTTVASPPVTTTYTVTGTPTAACLSTTIEKQIVVEILSPPAGPDTVGVTCNDAGSIVNLSDYLIDEVGVGFWEETNVPATGGFDGDSTFVPDGITAGDYTWNYIVLGIDGCPNDTLGLTLTVSQEVTAGLDSTTQICQSETIDLNTLLNGADPGGTWSETTFSGGFDPSGTFDPATTGIGSFGFTYTVAGTDPCPDDEANFVVTVLANPVITIYADDDDQELCDTDPITLTASGAGTSGTYVWDNGIMNGETFVQDVGTVNYTVVGTDENGCFASNSMDVIVHPIPTVDIITTDSIGCDPFHTTFTGIVSEATDECLWSFGDGGESRVCGLVEHTYEQPGVYTVSYEITDIHGCVNSATNVDYITVIKTPEAAFSWSPWVAVVEDTEIEFENESEFSTHYEWDFGDNSPINYEVDPTHEFPPEVGDVEYYVTLTALNDIGCSDVTHHVIEVKDIIIFYIPNIFTPDGDQFNETFKPQFFSGIDIYDFHMIIYNRYGEILFESFDTESGWDGTYGSRGLIQDGTYVWQIEFKENMSDKRHTHTGHVSIMR
ncbi:MAG: PKD domain-containing protein [Flavobacteriales bacterium]|nr:PKD domain-containing protein [Flavobacteriales bacterium]